MSHENPYSWLVVEKSEDDAGEVVVTSVHDELLAARRSRHGLSAISMANYPTMRRLLGDGDPLIAFQRLQHRILESLDTGDDVRAIEAAAYSLGLGSAGETHLDRLADFGTEYGYEVRQVRRYSDLGIQQLSRLITSNWIVHSVPTLEVFATQQTNASFLITLKATRPNLIDMSAVEPVEIDHAGNRAQVDAELLEEASQADVVQILKKPFVLAAAQPRKPRHLRFEWRGEIWPRFVMNVVGPILPEYVLTSQTLGNAMQLSVEVTT